MIPSETAYITLCKRLIEEKFHFEKENDTLRQRDLEYLADCIEEKAGIKLSLSTLKRLWKKEYNQTPHLSTLQALASILGYKDWQEFKLQATSIPSAPLTLKEKNEGHFKWWMIAPLVVALAVLFWLKVFRSGEPDNTKPVIKGPIIFTGNKTVAQGVPNTIIFNYDVSKVKADSFFFQQSWNEQQKVKIDPKGHYCSNIYYYPGFHKAKLIANDSILKRFAVHITTDGWMPLVRYSFLDNTPVYLKKVHPIVNGALHITRNDILSSGVNVDKDLVLSYFNVREFEDTYSDNFSLDTRFICDSNNTVACPGLQLVIICEANIFFIRMMGKGCESYTGIQLGEVFQDGTKNNLSAFGRDLHKWQQLRIKVVSKKATIYLDGQPVYTLSFRNDFGKVVGLAYHFNTTGAVDYVKLKNGEGKLVYEDEFDE